VGVDCSELAEECLKGVRGVFFFPVSVLPLHDIYKGRAGQKERDSMSVFRVRLSNSRQGLLDIYDNQRTAYIMGPNRINRRLKDGEVFTDCNYWKRFAHPNLPLEEAFIEVVEDDGTIYSDQIRDNTYPKVYDISAAAGSGFEDNRADIAGDSGSFALFAQITNKGSESIRVRINGLDSAIIDLPGGATQTFAVGDLTIGLIEVANQSEETVDVQIVVSVRVASTS